MKVRGGWVRWLHPQGRDGVSPRPSLASQVVVHVLPHLRHRWILVDAYVYPLKAEAAGSVVRRFRSGYGLCSERSSARYSQPSALEAASQELPRLGKVAGTGRLTDEDLRRVGGRVSFHQRGFLIEISKGIAWVVVSHTTITVFYNFVFRIIASKVAAVVVDHAHGVWAHVRHVVVFAASA